MSDDLSRRGLDLEGFAQTLRIAHCAKTDNDHPCVGTCTITPIGVELSCKLCGEGKEPIAPSETLDEVRVAKAALAGLGVDWDAISPETQRRIYALVKATDLVRRAPERNAVTKPDDLNDLRVPDGWTLELVRGMRDFAVLTAPAIGGTTIDFQLRGFRGGFYVMRGLFVGEKVTRQGSKRKAYGGRGWKQALIDDAVAWLRGVAVR